MHGVCHILSRALSNTYTDTHTHIHPSQLFWLGHLCERLFSCWLTVDWQIPMGTQYWVIHSPFPLAKHVVKGKMASYEKSISVVKGICAKGSCFPFLSQDTQVPLLNFLYAGPWKRSLTLGKGTRFPFKPSIFIHCYQKITTHYVVL